MGTGQARVKDCPIAVQAMLQHHLAAAESIPIRFGCRCDAGWKPFHCHRPRKISAVCSLMIPPFPLTNTRSHPATCRGPARPIT